MKGYEISKNSTVAQMATFRISGNVIPLEWFNHIRRENEKPYDVAIMLLADIVYWYRPIELRDETTGKQIGYRQKFAADKLQRGYRDFANLYGYTKLQIRDALSYLEKIGLIDLDFRHPIIDGKQFGNVLYIGLNVKRLMEITTLSTLNSIGYEDISQYPLDFKVDTNTETTTEILEKKEELTISDVYTFYQNGIGPVGHLDWEPIQDLVEDHTAKWVIEAIKIANERSKRSLGYVKAILQRWKVEGYGSEFKPSSRSNGRKPPAPEPTRDHQAEREAEQKAARKRYEQLKKDHERRLREANGGSTESG